MGMKELYYGELFMSNSMIYRGAGMQFGLNSLKLRPRTSCHSPFSINFRTINGILQNLTPFGEKISTPEWSSKIPAKISPMLFQRLETVISMLLGMVPVNITSNSDNVSWFGLYDLAS